MSRRKARTVWLTLPQARYLRDLVQDDLEVTDLTSQEREQALVIEEHLVNLVTRWEQSATRVESR